VGVDISKAYFDAVLLLDGGQRRAGRFDNNLAGFQRLQLWLEQLQVRSAHVGLEATGRYGLALACWLHEHHHGVSLLNPYRVKAYGTASGKRNKTDRADAELIAEFVATQQPPAWQPPSEDQARLQALVRRLEDVQRLLRAEKNRLHEAAPAVSTSIQRLIKLLQTEVQTLLKQIQHSLENDPTLRRQSQLLCSIPGVAWLSAARVLAELPSPQQLRHARRAAALAGLHPRRHESGSSVRRSSRLSKQGRRPLRAALYMPALVARRRNPLLKAFADRLAAKGKSKKAVICAVMRKLLHIIFGILKHEKPFNPNYATTNYAPA
jgi:transposase